MWLQVTGKKYFGSSIMLYCLLLMLRDLEREKNRGRAKKKVNVYVCSVTDALTRLSLIA